MRPGGLHEAPVIVDLVDDISGVFHHFCEKAGVNQRSGQRLIQCVVVPVDLCDGNRRMFLVHNHVHFRVHNSGAFSRRIDGNVSHLWRHLSR